MTIAINGGHYTAEEIVQAIAESNDPQPDLSLVEEKLGQIEARLHAIENKVANMPLNWSIN